MASPWHRYCNTCDALWVMRGCTWRRNAAIGETITSPSKRAAIRAISRKSLRATDNAIRSSRHSFQTGGTGKSRLASPSSSCCTWVLLTRMGVDVAAESPGGEGAGVFGLGFCRAASKESNIDDCMLPSAGWTAGGGGGGEGLGFCGAASKEAKIDDCIPPSAGWDTGAGGGGSGLDFCGAASKESNIDDCVLPPAGGGTAGGGGALGFCGAESNESKIDDCIPPPAAEVGGGGGLGLGFCGAASKESKIDDCAPPASEGVGLGLDICGAASKESKMEDWPGCSLTGAATSCFATSFCSKVVELSVFSSTAYKRVFIEANSFPRRASARETSNADAYRTLLLVLSRLSKSGADEKSIILLDFARTRSLAEAYFFFSFAAESNAGGTTTSMSPAGTRAMHKAA
mmetsp:Transcript_13340/g.38061  ORF Transcript_13340/g.38061 Transcript_13340/m.38061 type:complete len:402 (+) Transcript_13340:3015-4220(+)